MEENCPICGKLIDQKLLERHVNSCLDNLEGTPTPILTADDTIEEEDTTNDDIPDKKRNMFSALGLKADSSQTIKKKKSVKGSTLTDLLLKERRVKSSQDKPEPSLEEQFKEAVADTSTQRVKSEEIAEQEPPKRQSDILTRANEMHELKRLASLPLAHRLRPKSLDDFYGQEHLLGKNGPLRNIIEADHIPSFLLWGGPGIGKTTLARIIAKSTSCKFVELSGAESNAKSLKQVFTQAENHRNLTNQRTILFLDEIHRFNKAVQDLLLPAIEKGVVTVIGATTENPSFTLNNALLSRVHTFVMEPLTQESIVKILGRALYEVNKFRKQVYGLHYVSLSKDGFDYIASLSMGDSRIALNILESVNAYLSTDKFSTADEPEGTKQGVIKIDESILRPLLKTRNFHQVYDRKGESHYDIISAFHKSVRGSDPDAAMFYLVKMLSGGEDPMFIIRRMIVIASEDIGLRDSSVLPFVVAAKDALEFVGMPEGEIILAHVANKLARSPKSTKSYRSLRTAQKLISEEPELTKLPVPLHLRNAPTKLMKELGYGKEYKYNPNYVHGKVKQGYFPDGMEPVKFLNDVHLGRVKDPEVDENEYELSKLAEEDYTKFKKRFREKSRQDYNEVSFGYDEFLDKDVQPEYFEGEVEEEDDECRNNFGKSYDEFLDPDSQPDYFDGDTDILE
ncbi:DNA-dependent ATPase MGS1 [Spathaspora sp. JA1]|nr:DNA-dependent ATPase MGS1 [Spathaspora sp. JA1]